MAYVTGSSSRSRSALEALGKFLAELRQELFGKYHPERHYMRGSNPAGRRPTERSRDPQLASNDHLS